MNLQLRPYQKEAIIEVIKLQSDGKNRQLISLPTGSGKTVVFAGLIAQLNVRTIVFAHTTELVLQTEAALKMMLTGIDIGVVNADRKEFGAQVVVSSIQAAYNQATRNQLGKQNFKLCIYDEAHHAAARSARRVLADLGFMSGAKLLVGVTATPFRKGALGLGEIFETVSYQKNINQMIDDGYLVKPIGIKIAHNIDLSAVKATKEDFQTTALASYMDTDELNSALVQTYMQKAESRKTVCFATSVKHAQRLSAMFIAYGIKSECIHGNMSTDERTAILKRFAADEFTVLTNCQLLTEGWNDCSVRCVIPRVTKSKTTYIQQVGRGLRLYPNKNDCLVIDWAENKGQLFHLARLTKDAEIAKEGSGSEGIGKLTGFNRRVPPALNKRLKTVLLEFDPLGKQFNWSRDEVGAFHLKGIDCELRVEPTGSEYYKVVFSANRVGEKAISRELTFNYAFGAAEDWAKKNKHVFVFNDFNAPWRNLPISEKQVELFKSYGFSAGINEITRGQAAVLIESGALR